MQRITRQEAELQTLRREHAARQKQLDSLTRRKQDLQAQLKRVESEIEAVTGGNAPADSPPQPAAPTPAPSKSRPQTAPPPAKGEPALSMPQLLPVLLREAGRPLTIKELTEAVRSRRPAGQSADLLKQVSTRVSELVKKGVLRRTPDQKAVTVPGSPNGKKAAPPPAKAAAPKQSPPPAKPAKSKAPPEREQPSLQAVLTKILADSPKPLGGGELARRALAAGYKSTSKHFPNVVWVVVGKMENVEHVKGQGYRLKKRSQ